MDFKQLQSFVAVAKYKSFSLAAKKLFISQPTISTHIKLLEDELESRLFIRSPKNLELTPRGQEFYECATSILSLHDGLINRWSDNSNSIIQISASTLPSTYILPEILPDFCHMYPNTYFNISQSDSTKVIRDVYEDKCSIGLTGMRSDNDRLEFIPFYEDNMVIITPVTEHFLDFQKRDDTNIEELFKEPIIIRESESGTQKRADKFLKELNISEDMLNIVARINDPEAIKNLVAGNMGISLISHKAALDFEKAKRILVFTIPEYKMTRNLYIVYKKDYIFQKNIQTFINYVKDYYKKS